MTRILIHDYWGDHVEAWLGGLIQFFDGQGAQVDVWTRESPPGAGAPARVRRRIRKQLAGFDHVYMWNGQNDHHHQVRAACAELGIPCSILEVGYFPQREWFTIDPQGINATSTLMTDPLDWVDQDHLQALAELRSRYLAGRTWRGGGGFVLVPLQLSSDTNVRDHTDVRDMQEFIDRCESRWPDQRIVFKVHPLDDSDYRTRGELLRGGDFLDLAVEADRIVGLNSTCLLEAALLGAPVEARGNGFLRVHGHQPERLLAALVDKQVPVGSADVRRWVERYSAPLPCSRRAS